METNRKRYGQYGKQIYVCGKQNKYFWKREVGLLNPKTKSSISFWLKTLPKPILCVSHSLFSLLSLACSSLSFSLCPPLSVALETWKVSSVLLLTLIKLVCPLIVYGEKKHYFFFKRENLWLVSELKWPYIQLQNWVNVPSVVPFVFFFVRKIAEKKCMRTKLDESLFM